MKTRCASLLMFVAVCAGCAAKKHLTADQYFQEATKSFRGNALNLAVEEYHELLDQYPFSPYNEEAELKIAHAQYLDGNYAEAIVALTDFQRRHPTSPQLPFVGYYLGMCYAQQMRTLDRDQTATQNALNYFLTVSQQYPDSPFAELAREQVARCRENLAQHEMYIAKFYAGQGKDRAAEIRLLTMASRYGDTDAGAAGLLRLARLYSREKQEQNEVLAYQALAQLHPRGPESVAAHRALDRLANVDPPSGDPLDLLLAANGRHRSTGTFETVQVPGLDTERTGRRPSAAAPAMVPPMDPFGRGRSGGSGFPY